MRRIYPVLCECGGELFDEDYIIVTADGRFFDEACYERAVKDDPGMEDVFSGTLKEFLWLERVDRDYQRYKEEGL